MRKAHQAYLVSHSPCLALPQRLTHGSKDGKQQAFIWGQRSLWASTRREVVSLVENSLPLFFRFLFEKNRWKISQLPKGVKPGTGITRTTSSFWSSSETETEQGIKQGEELWLIAHLIIFTFQGLPVHHLLVTNVFLTRVIPFLSLLVTTTSYSGKLNSWT